MSQAYNSLQSPLPTSTPHHAVTYIARPTTRLFSSTDQAHTNQISSRSSSVSAPAFPYALLGLSADLVSVLVLSIILYRTYRYVSQRRSGLVGPSPAPLLLKFWALYGLIETASQILSLYLAPFQADWLFSTARAVILIFLISGPHLGIAELLYNRKLGPFFDTHALGIERQFSVARKHWDEVNEAFRELATYLLKRIAVGGLSNAVTVPSAEDEAHHASRQPTESSKRAEGALLPKEAAVFPTGRTFFAGEADYRAEIVRNARAGSLGGAVQVAIPEAPRPAYDEARAMRERFRNRFKKADRGKDNIS